MISAEEVHDTTISPCRRRSWTVAQPGTSCTRAVPGLCQGCARAVKRNFMRCMLMIAPYRARVQYSAVTTASPFLHLSTTLGIPPPQSRAIREHHGHRRPSTPVHGRAHPSTAVTAVHGRQQLFISVHGRHGCPWPSTAVTAVHGHHCRPWLPTAVTAAHGCRPAG